MALIPVVSHEERDIEKLRRVLQKDPVSAGYLLGDLDAMYVQHTQWLVADWADKTIAVVLLYTGLSSPVVLSYGAPDGIQSILQECHHYLPDNAHAKIPAAHYETWKEQWSVQDVDRLWVMAADKQSFRPLSSGYDVRRLQKGYPVSELRRSYESYPGNYFEPSQLETNVYYGLFIGAELASISGTHVFSPSMGVAVIGNIVTTAAHRGNGLATVCTSRLVEQLLADGCHTIVLQVASSNRQAIAVYRRLGFSFDSDVLQCQVSLRMRSAKVPIRPL
jgi:ribosomal protein S18 acetylase RimI-like enzyme